MHIVIGIITLLAAVSFWIYRIRAASEAVQEMADIADGLVRLPRRLAYRRKSGRGGIELVDDPREAAAVLMCEIGRVAGHVTDATRQEIVARIETEFALPSEDAGALFDQANWMLRDAPLMHVVVGRMTRLVYRSAGAEALKSLDAMLLSVAQAHGEVSEPQADMLAEYRRLVISLLRAA